MVVVVFVANKPNSPDSWGRVASFFSAVVILVMLQLELFNDTLVALCNGKTRVINQESTIITAVGN